MDADADTNADSDDFGFLALNVRHDGITAFLLVSNLNPGSADVLFTTKLRNELPHAQKRDKFTHKRSWSR